MSKRRRTAIPGPPLTNTELEGKALKKEIGRQIVCSKCKVPGFGTLVKEGDNYVHQSSKVCEIARRYGVRQEASHLRQARGLIYRRGSTGDGPALLGLPKVGKSSFSLKWGRD